MLHYVLEKKFNYEGKKMEIDWRLKLKIVEVYRTQADFAQAMGIDDSEVSRVVRGRKQLDSAQKGKWAKALGCTITDIF